MQTKAKYDEFEIQGCFGCREYKVKIGKNNQGQHFLLNFFHINLKDQVEKLQIIQNLDHPSILKIFQIRNEGVYTKKNNSVIPRSCVIYEYPPAGELYEYLFQTGKFHEAQARHYFKQLVEGLITIHNQGLYHGGLTTEVIFFNDPKNVKIAELGLNKMRKKKYTYESQQWTKDNENSEQSKDIFALGVILFILMVGKPPFSSTLNPNFLGFQSENQFIWKEMQKNYPNVAFTNEFKDLLQGIFTQSPKNRLSLSEVYKHPWTQIKTEFTEEMVREFYSKQIKIEQFIRKANLTRQLQQQKMIISGDKSKLQEGVADFRTEAESQKVQQEQKQTEAVKLISSDLIRFDSYLTNQEPKEIIDLMKKSFLKKFNFQIVKEYQNNEFCIIIKSDLNATVKVEIFQLETQKNINLEKNVNLENNINCVIFNRMEGDLFDYIQTIERFHQLIDEIQQELSKNSQGEEKSA